MVIHTHAHGWADTRMGRQTDGRRHKQEGPGVINSRLFAIQTVGGHQNLFSNMKTNRAYLFSPVFRIALSKERFLYSRSMLSQAHR